MRALSLLVPTRCITPRGLALRAVEFAAPFLIAHLLGLRRFTSVLCGTMDTGELAGPFSALAGLVYVLLYLGATVVAPILAIGAGLLWSVQHIARRRHDC